MINLSNLGPWISILYWLLIAAALILIFWVMDRGETKVWAGFIDSWLCLSAAAGYLLWAISSSPVELQHLQNGLAQYVFFLCIGGAASGILVLIMLALGAGQQLTLLSYVSCIAYFSFFKVLGWNLIPWVLVILIAAVFIYLRKSAPKIGPSVLLLQIMGTFAGLYMSFHLQEFLSAWGPFKEVASGLWLLLGATM